MLLKKLEDSVIIVFEAGWLCLFKNEVADEMCQDETKKLPMTVLKSWPQKDSEINMSQNIKCRKMI